MKLVITCVQFAMELTPYNEAGQVMPRPKPLEFVVFEADIPESVKEWLTSKLPKEA